tara:strand:- start:1782 stop:2165 length:384 start_codon:yes stop_codon:yes gene_type:complete
MPNMAPKTALLVIDHGSRRKAANHMLFDVVLMLRTMRPNALIYGAHMELALPTISDGVRWCIQRGATHIIAHPYMLSPGRHAMEDIPRLVQQALAEHPHVTFTVTEPLGVDMDLGDLIFKRAGLNSP